MSDFYRREDINMGVYRRKAQYHETDQMGIIHHSNYVKWMEEARIDFMKELGFGYGAGDCFSGCRGFSFL